MYHDKSGRKRDAQRQLEFGSPDVFPPIPFKT
jgi:hypothetical protein